MVNKRILLFIVLIIFIISIITGCFRLRPQTNQNTTINNGVALNIVEAENSLNLTTYDGGFFTINLPQGWMIETVGEYEGFGFKAYDPAKPERQIFYYGKVEPLLKTAEAKQWYTDVANMVGGSYYIFADAPYINPETIDSFLYKFNDFAYFVNQYGVYHNFPYFYNIEVLEKMPLYSSFSGVAVDDSIVRTIYENENSKKCQALVAGSVIDIGTYYVENGIDTWPIWIYNFMGVTAGEDEFPALEEELTESLSSFKFTQEYIDAGVRQNQEETEAFLRINAEMQAAYDSYNSAWSSRDTTYDVISQKNSDANLGYDRLYDSVTGETFRAELGFYDSYDINRGEYSNSNLYKVENDDYNNYLKNISGYIYN